MATMRDAAATLGRQRTGDAPFGGRRKLPRSRGTSPNEVPRKQQRAGEREAKGDTAADADVMDLVAQVHLKLCTRLESRVRDLEAATYQVLHSVPTKRQRHRERSARRRQSIPRVGNKPPRQRKRKLPHLVLDGNAEGHRRDSGAEGRERGTDTSQIWPRRRLHRYSEQPSRTRSFPS